MKRALTKTSKLPRTSGLLAGCLAAVALLVTASAASAKTFYPTRTDDPAPNGCKKKDCSLREAVIAANANLISATNPAPSIVLRPGKEYKLTRKGAGEDASMTGDLDLHGARVKTKKGRGAELAVIDGNDIDRIFDGGVTLARVVLRDGHARAGVDDDGNGGAIEGGGLILKSRLVSNVADGKGGAVYNDHALGINRTLLKGNRAAGDGGAVYFLRSYCDRDRNLEITNSRATHNSAGGAGGAIFGFCSVGIRNTYLGGNRAEGPGGAAFSPNGLEGSGGVWLLDSTVAGNQSESYGGGLAVEAGGGGRVDRSTVSGNSADSGGGIGTFGAVGVENSTIANNGADRNGGGIGAFGQATVQLDSVTVARNAADEGFNGGSQGPGAGGGLYSEVDSVVSVRNTIVALNGRRSPAPPSAPIATPSPRPDSTRWATT